MSQGNLSGYHNPRWQHLARTQKSGPSVNHLKLNCADSKWNTQWTSLSRFCTLTKGWMRANLTSVFHRSSVTWLSHDGVEEIRTVEIIVVGSFQMRQKPHLGSPEKVSQRLRVKVTTILNTLISPQGHLQTATWMYNGICPVLAKTGKPLARNILIRFPLLQLVSRNEIHGPDHIYPDCGVKDQIPPKALHPDFMKMK